MDSLENLVLGSVGDVFVALLSADLVRMRGLKSLTLFTYRVLEIDCLTDAVMQLPFLCEVHVWPSNPQRRLLPSREQFDRLERAVHSNRLRFIRASALLEGKIPLSVWPFLLSRLGRIASHDENGNRIERQWCDVSYALLRDSMEMFHRQCQPCGS